MRDCGLALLWFSQSILVAIVTRDVEELEKNLVAFVTMTFHLYKKNQTPKHLLSQLPQEEQLGLWQLWQEILRGLKKNLVAFVTMIIQLCLKIFHKVLWQL